MNIKEELKCGKNIYDLPLRVVYYARVSTLSELQNSSIINQVDYFYNFILNIKNWSFCGGYIDEGLSAKRVSKRENFIKMINDGRCKKYDLILTKSVSRFARNTVDSIKYTDLLLSCGIGVMFVNDNINTFYSDSEFRLTLMASIAQDELRKLSESVKFGLNQSINRGIVLGNSNIYGYNKSNGKLVIDEVESRIVIDIYNLFLSGIYNYSKISRIIKSKYNRSMDCNTVKRILTNYKYKGYYCGKKSEVIDYKNGIRRKIASDNWVVYKDYDNVPPIISEELWDKVNFIIRKLNKKNIPFYSVFCLTHGKVVKYKSKRYKDNVYFYFKCSCFSLSSKLLDKINGVKKIKNVYVKKEQDLVLIIKY